MNCFSGKTQSTDFFIHDQHKESDAMLLLHKTHFCTTGIHAKHPWNTIANIFGLGRLFFGLGRLFFELGRLLVVLLR